MHAHELLDEYAATIEQTLSQALGVLNVSAAKKTRFLLLLLLAPMLPDDCLHWVPLFLPEAILGTKEINRKSRLLAFELLLGWARRMALGGQIQASKTNGLLDQDGTATEREKSRYL